MRMYAHQAGAIKDLYRCRINPDFQSLFRDDLEFFIPQLCSFYLKGNLATKEDAEYVEVEKKIISIFQKKKLSN